MHSLLPSKLVGAERSSLGEGAKILGYLTQDNTLGIAGLWAKFHDAEPDVGFERFCDALTLLYAIGVIDEAGRIKQGVGT